MTHSWNIHDKSVLAGKKWKLHRASPSSSTDNFKYWNTVAYRFGANYDSGYLTVSDTKIDSYGVSAGLGLPFSKNSSSMLNLTYSYGKEGTLDNNLIIDNIHKLSLNLSLNGRWFQKKKIY